MPIVPRPTTQPSKAVMDPLSADEARAIAKEAYLYGFPIVDNYRILHAYFANQNSLEYKGPPNQVINTARVYTPDDKTIQSPNSDTPYSFVGADLRVEPLVFSVPEVEKGRYYSVQFIDQYTFNFAYAGSRSTGNEAGHFLLAGPGWSGPIPKGIKSILRSETQFALVLFRTQLFGPGDIENVKKVQAGYNVQPLSTFLGQPSLKPRVPVADLPKPLSAADERTSLAFFSILNFVLQFCPTHPSELALMERFAKLGIGADETFAAQSVSPEIHEAIAAGMADAWHDYVSVQQKKAKGEVNSGDLFGTRAYLANNYLYRMVGAADGIYGNSKDEAIYPGYIADTDGEKLDGARRRYTLRFEPGKLPPVVAFWSLTMYDFPSRLLVANPLNRYLINSPMLPDLKRDEDGGLTLHIQRNSPGPDRESNWLPTPKGPFIMALRLYWPKAEALSGEWQKPPLQRLP